MFSSVRLHAGPVFAYEFDRTGSPPGQVILSACDLGAVTPREGGEALGLTSVLLHLGVHASWPEWPASTTRLPQW